ncbi:hypothetical protein Focb16_v003140 [Fusarium oxysporum f. sp. cubense]|uniref:Uncharacterized protein n=1 Tax=Fusarium oxysporum f. sp. cubense TaxID=61366 RepID=A0A559L5M7_FUSOC|nr:hypothetical protein Focb16_v003140 [Fusarium oxysporum f. sp. cubense]
MPDTELLYKCARFEIRRLVPKVLDDNIDNIDNSDVHSVKDGPLLSIVAVDDTEEQPRIGTISCAVMVGGEMFIVSPAHIFLPRPPEEPEETEETEEDMDETESDSGSEALRAGSVTPPDIDAALSSSQDFDDILDDV